MGTSTACNVLGRSLDPVENLVYCLKHQQQILEFGNFEIDFGHVDFCGISVLEGSRTTVVSRT